MSVPSYISADLQAFNHVNCLIVLVSWQQSHSKCICLCTFFLNSLNGAMCSAHLLMTNQAAWLLLHELKCLYSSERIFQDSSNSKSTVHRCSGTCENASGSRTKITRYGYNPPPPTSTYGCAAQGDKTTSFTIQER